jgi:MFS family permease
MPLRSLIATFPREVWILFAGTMLNRFGSFVLVFLILYLTRRGFTPGEAGFAVASYGIGGMAASILGGWLADRIGRRRTIALSMFSAAATILMLGRAQSLAEIVVWTVLMGLTAESYRPASAALLTDLTRPDQRVTVFAGYRLAINFGAMIGPAVGGLIAEASFAWLFVGDAITCALFGVIALVALPDGAHGRAAPAADHPRHSILRDNGFMVFLIASTAVAFMYAQSHSGFALEVSGRGEPNRVYGLLLALNAFLVLLLELPLSRWTRTRRRRPMIALGWALIGLGFGLTPWGAGVPWLTLTVLIWTLGEIISAPVGAAYVADVAPDHMRGRYMGAWTMTWGLGYVLGPSLGGWLFGIGPHALWGACLGLGAVAATMVMLAPPSRRPEVTS